MNGTIKPIHLLLEKESGELKEFTANQLITPDYTDTRTPLLGA